MTWFHTPTTCSAGTACAPQGGKTPGARARVVLPDPWDRGCYQRGNHGEGYSGMKFSFRVSLFFVIYGGERGIRTLEGSIKPATCRFLVAGIAKLAIPAVVHCTLAEVHGRSRR